MNPSDNTLKLLYITLHDPHVPLTGTGARVGAFVNFLAGRYHVDVVYMDGSGQPPSPELSAFYANSIVGVASKTCIPYSPRGYFLFSPAVYRAAAEKLRQRRYDYIICDYGLSAAYALLLSSRFKTPFVYSSHNIEFRANLTKAKRDPRRLPLALYMYAVEKLAVKRARCVVAISQAEADEYATWTSRDKILVIPQGFDERQFNPWYPSPHNARKTILFCGNFRIQFNREVIDTVMERVLKPVLKEYPDALFRFVGTLSAERRASSQRRVHRLPRGLSGRAQAGGCRDLADAAGLGIPDQDRRSARLRQTDRDNTHRRTRPGTRLPHPQARGDRQVRRTDLLDVAG